MSNSNLKVAIAVVGVANTGKTTTIDSVRTSLLSDGWKEICRVVLKVSKAKHIDEKSILKKGDIKIAICPRGDGADHVEDGFVYAINHEADIILYARRTKGPVISVIEKYQKKNNFKSFEIKKNNINSNEAKKQELLNLINDSIKDIH